MQPCCDNITKEQLPLSSSPGKSSILWGAIRNVLGLSPKDTEAVSSLDEGTLDSDERIKVEKLILDEKRIQVQKYQPILLVSEREKLCAIPLSTLVGKEHSVACAAFTTFLEIEHATENLQFWHVCHRFRTSFDHNKPQVNLACAKSIYRVFLVPNAPQWVCCSNFINDTIKHKILCGDVTEDTFEEARESVQHDMQADLLPRFISIIFPESARARIKLEDMYLRASWDLHTLRAELCANLS